MDYKSAGVDVEAGYEAVRLMKGYVAQTHNKNVLQGLGSFGGFFALGEGEDADVLVAGTDGVGTKLKYAIELGVHDTIGIDAVAMCANDLICQGARPLFFLDYIAQDKIVPQKVADIVKGVAEGCKLSGMALIGGETAEMPGFYKANDYDIAGFAVGIVKRKNVINGSGIKAGDVLIGLASSGLHSNGFSLVRKLLGETPQALAQFDSRLGGNAAKTVLTPTRLYVKSILSVIEKFKIKGVANITGGGFIENIPRIFPEGIGAEIDINSFPKQPVFGLLAELSGASVQSLYNTFNMGIGMVLAVNPADAGGVIAHLEACGEAAYAIGKTVCGAGIALNA
jgi:phosphoribosylformylglycinamidine cyclo-ligase